jgi:hypothetical protein
MPSSSSDFASVTAIAGLAHPRVLPSAKTIVFDAQVYLGPAPEDFLIGSLRYFNKSNMTFSDSPQLYMIYATVSFRALTFSGLSDLPVDLSSPEESHQPRLMQAKTWTLQIISSLAIFSGCVKQLPF